MENWQAVLLKAMFFIGVFLSTHVFSSEYVKIIDFDKEFDEASKFSYVYYFSDKPPYFEVVKKIGYLASVVDDKAALVSPVNNIEVAHEGYSFDISGQELGFIFVRPNGRNGSYMKSGSDNIYTYLTVDIASLQSAVKGIYLDGGSYTTVKVPGKKLNPYKRHDDNVCFKRFKLFSESIEHLSRTRCDQLVFLEEPEKRVVKKFGVEKIVLESTAYKKSVIAIAKTQSAADFIENELEGFLGKLERINNRREFGLGSNSNGQYFRGYISIHDYERIYCAYNAAFC